MSRSIRLLPVLLLIGAVDAAARLPSGPWISSVTPSIGRPAGGEIVRITGYGFDAPVRVFFKSEFGEKKEALVVSLTTMQIDVVTPAFEFPAGKQSMAADIQVILRAGTVYETRTERERAFDFRNERLTPAVLAVTPNHGSLNGETRVTIVGEGFQAPVQVFLFRDGDAALHEMRVIGVDFHQIMVLTPPGDDLPPYVPLHLRVVNLNSNRQTDLPNAFRYTASPSIHAVTPNHGLQIGGTRVHIDGIAFEPPVVVDIAGVTAQPIRVSGTQIDAITSPLPFATCEDVTGPIVITNIFDGAQAIGGEFTYRSPGPRFERIPAEPVMAGSTIDVVGSSDTSPIRFTIGGIPVVPVVSHDHVWTLPVPTSLTFPRELCFVDGEAGTRLAQRTFELVVSAETSGCKWKDLAWISVLPASAPCTVRPRPSDPPVPPNGR